MEVCTVYETVVWSWSGQTGLGRSCSQSRAGLDCLSASVVRIMIHVEDPTCLPCLTVRCSASLVQDAKIVALVVVA